MQIVYKTDGTVHNGQIFNCVYISDLVLPGYDRILQPFLPLQLSVLRMWCVRVKVMSGVVWGCQVNVAFM